MAHPNPDIMLDDVVLEQKRDLSTLAFRPKIEDAYRTEFQTEHRKFALINMVIGIGLFDAYIVCDYIQDPKNILLFVVMRILVVTPLCLAILFAVKRYKLHLKKYYFYFICAGPTIMCLANSMVLLHLESGNYRLSYLFGEIVIMLCAVVLCRPDFRTACIMIIAQSICYQAALMGSNIVEPEFRLPNSMFAFASGLISVMNAYILERISRQSFLLNLRVTLLNQALERLSITDPLTGLGNRRALEEATQRVWASSGEGRIVSMILLDVDHFKSFNDTYGHPAGDRCLSEIGCCVARHVRGGQDIAIRFGGEELVVLLPDTDFNQACQMAETLRLSISALSIAHSALGPNVVVTASFGVASALTLQCTPTELAARADTALYAAKRNGRNQVWPALAAAPGPRQRAAPMAAVA